MKKNKIDTGNESKRFDITHITPAAPLLRMRNSEGIIFYLSKILKTGIENKAACLDIKDSIPARPLRKQAQMWRVFSFTGEKA